MAAKSTINPKILQWAREKLGIASKKLLPAPKLILRANARENLNLHPSNAWKGGKVVGKTLQSIN